MCDGVREGEGRRERSTCVFVSRGTDSGAVLLQAGSHSSPHCSPEPGPAYKGTLSCDYTLNHVTTSMISYDYHMPPILPDTADLAGYSTVVLRSVYQVCPQ